MGLPADLHQIADHGRRRNARRWSSLNIGNPQCDRARPAARRRAFQPAGRGARASRAFPEGTNVEFAQVESPDRLRIRIWERGCRSDLVVGHRIVRVADCRGRVRRRRSRRRGHRARRHAARRVARRKRLTSPAGPKCCAKGSGCGRCRLTRCQRPGSAARVASRQVRGVGSSDPTVVTFLRRAVAGG